MSRFRKSILAVAGLATAFVMLGIVAVPQANAQTVAELQAQISSLLATIQQLQTVIASMGGGTPTPSIGAFTQNLTIGSTGNEVMQLQKFLNSKGFTVAASGAGSPGNESSYFGSLTQAALAKYQAANGISPAAGYFGPITRANVNQMLVTTPSTTPTVPGTTVPGPQPGGVEGAITTKLSSSPSDNPNVRSSTDVKVYGIEVTAVNSDMVVDRLDLQVSVTPTGGSAENPGIFIKGIKVWDGSTLLREVSVDNTSFSKDSSDRYHIIIGGIGFKVVKDAKRDVTVSFTVGSISTTDVNRAITVQGYAGNTQNVRAVDTLGINQYADMSGSANTRTHTFKPAGNATLTASLNNSLTAKESNQAISTSNSTKVMKLVGFSVKAETGDGKITDMFVQVGGTSTVAYPDVLYICKASDTNCASPVRSVSGPTTGVTPQVKFTNINYTVAQDTTENFFIAGEFGTDTNQQIASTSLPANAIKWEKPDGSTASTSNTGTIVGKDQHLFDEFPRLTLLSSEATKSTVDGSTFSTTTLTFKLKVKMENVGGSTMVKPAASDFVLYLASTTASTTLKDAATLTYNGYSAINGGNAYTATTTAGAVGTFMQASTTLALSGITPTDSTVGDGDNYTFDLIGTISNRCATSAIIGGALCGGTNTAGNYRMMLVAASSTVGTTQFLLTGVNAHSWGFDGFETPTQFLNN